MHREEALNILERFISEKYCLHLSQRLPNESCEQFRKKMLAEDNSNCWNCLVHKALETIKDLNL